MKTQNRRRGFSLLEVLIAVAILGIVLGMVYMSLFSSTAEYEVNARRSWILHQARTALDEMAEDIRQGNRLQLTPSVATVEGVESAAATQISFFKVTTPNLATGAAVYSTYKVSYIWKLSDNTETVVDPVNTTAPGQPYKLPGAMWVDANGNNIQDEGRILRIDPNPNDQGLIYPARIMCNYVKNSPDGFKIYQLFRTVNGIRQYQLRIVLTLVFTDSRNKVVEQELETKIFMRNSQ